MITAPTHSLSLYIPSSLTPAPFMASLTMSICPFLVLLWTSCPAVPSSASFYQHIQCLPSVMSKSSDFTSRTSNMCRLSDGLAPGPPRGEVEKLQKAQCSGQQRPAESGEDCWKDHPHNPLYQHQSLQETCLHPQGPHPPTPSTNFTLLASEEQDFWPEKLWHQTPKHLSRILQLLLHATTPSACTCTICTSFIYMTLTIHLRCGQQSKKAIIRETCFFTV